MTDHITLDPETCGIGLVERLVQRAVAPRPIVLVSTLDEQARSRLDLISWYSSAAVSPPIQYFALPTRDGESEGLLTRIRRTGEFVLNSVDEEVARALAGCAERGNADFGAFALRPRSSVKVAPYRVAESPAQMECRVLDVREVPGGGAHLVFGAVVQFHVRDGLYDDRGRIDQRSYRPVGQVSAESFCRCRDLYTMRPEGEP